MSTKRDKKASEKAAPAPTIAEPTPEQEAKLPAYRDKWMKIGTDTTPINQERARKVIYNLYENAGLARPNKIHFTSSPAAAIRLARELGAKDVSYDDFYWGRHEAGNMGFYDFFLNEVKTPGIEKMQLLIDACKELGWTLFYDTDVIVSECPCEVHIDDQSRLHNVKGPAVRFTDGENAVYAVHGVRLPAYVIEQPEKITVHDIEHEPNAEVRRVKIDQYGQSRYITDSGATVVHKDDFGTLFRKDIPGDEPLMMVKVVNSTAEPDGTFKDYFIRVDPNAYGGLKTARAAVASTWRNADGTLMFSDPNQYTLVEET